MIEIRIKINEKSNKKYKTFEGSINEIELIEIGKKATEGEIKTAELIKERLKLDEKIQIENLSKTKTKDEILEELLYKLI